MISFPFKNFREGQEDIVNTVTSCLKNGKHLLLHAPTGLGKTAGVLVPAIRYAVRKKLKVLFLTPRHTQQKIVYETIKKINEKNKNNISCVSFLGKKKMCTHDVSSGLRSHEFANFCNNLKKANACEYYEKTKKVRNLNEFRTMTSNEVVKYSKSKGLCGYELVCRLAEQARVVVGDYYYVFNPHIRNSLFNRLKIDLGNTIIIVDEAHNLSDRIRESCSSRITSIGLRASVREAEEYEMPMVGKDLEKFQLLMGKLANKLGNNKEMYVDKERFIKGLETLTGKDLEQFRTYLEYLSKEVYAKKEKSNSHAVSEFVSRLVDDNESRILIFSKYKDYHILENYNMDPRIVNQEVVDNAHSVIMMSGTLKPLRMHQELLGFHPEDTIVREYESGFPKNNRTVLINDEFTTRYENRNPLLYKRIGEKIASITNKDDKNVLLFMPSYDFQKKILEHFIPISKKTVFQESPENPDKHELLKSFAGYAGTGAVLSCVVGGSFSEGIDYPGSIAETAIIVGVPFHPPDLKTKALIKYYDYKFNNGWNYAYTYPALNKAIQAGGRCIRSPEDKGTIILMDSRYKRKDYHVVFPKEWEPRTTNEFNSFGFENITV